MDGSQRKRRFFERLVGGFDRMRRYTSTNQMPFREVPGSLNPLGLDKAESDGHSGPDERRQPDLE